MVRRDDAQRHTFGPLWTGFDMTMLAGLVANLSHVNLNSGDLILGESRQSVWCAELSSRRLLGYSNQPGTLTETTFESSHKDGNPTR